MCLNDGAPSAHRQEVAQSPGDDRLLTQRLCPLPRTIMCHGASLIFASASRQEIPAARSLSPHAETRLRASPQPRVVACSAVAHGGMTFQGAASATMAAAVKR